MAQRIAGDALEAVIRPRLGSFFSGCGLLTKRQDIGQFFGRAHRRGVVGAFVPILLAGAGINTQPAFQATKGLHGSTLFTLSLPVSRFRLLAVRASLGWFEMAVALGAWNCGVWFLFPILRAATSGLEVFEYAGTLVVCASGLYSISLLLATFLDDLWQLYGSMLAWSIVVDF